MYEFTFRIYKRGFNAERIAVGGYDYTNRTKVPTTTQYPIHRKEDNMDITHPPPTQNMKQKCTDEIP